MEIAPNSIIRLYSGVPLDPSYKNTIWFDTKDEQRVYFTFDISNPICKYNFTEQYYTRVNRRQIKVKVCADNVYDCNYMAFQNTSYGSKWFYAFITGVEWVNNEVTLITFEIDVMQTYMFDAELQPCFVVREHSVLDTIGYNLVPEPLDIGDLVANQADYDTKSSTADLCTIIGVLDENKTVLSDLFPVFEQVDGISYESIYGAVRLFAFDGDNHINAFLNNYKKDPDNIIMIYMCPVDLIGGYNADMRSDSGYKIPSYSISPVMSWALTGIDGTTTIDGYTPKNKKLLTAPFNFLMLFNSKGESLNLKYEDFNNYTPTFEINGNFSFPPNVQITPTNYKNLNKCKTETLILDEYPLCSWYSDYYSRWLAQVGLPTFGRRASQGLINLIHGGFDSSANAIGGAFNSAIGGVAYKDYKAGILGIEQNAVSGITGLASNLNRSLEIEANAIADFNTERAMAKIHEDVFKGSIATGSLAIATGQNKFRAVRMSIRYQIARRIDDFFNKYGYAMNAIKVPNRHVRPYYTYTKTAGCLIVGKMPADDILLMQQIYDAGITFWDRYATVGDYSVNNAPM